MYAKDKSDAGYVSYMLRVWSKRDGQGRQVWCASLQEPGSFRTENFEDTEAMFAYLQRKLGIEVPAEHGHAQHGRHGRQEQHPQGEQQAAQQG